MLPGHDEQHARSLLDQQRLMQELHGILEEEQKKDDVLKAMVFGSCGEHLNLIARPDPDRICSIDQIRTYCEHYRLRFLDASAFKGDLPPKALYELRRLDARSPDALKGFKVMAPQRAFTAPGSMDDAALFVPIGRKHYYAVHRWGSPLSPWRAALAWPFRSRVHLAISVVLVGAALSLLVPNEWSGAASTQGYWGPHRFLAALFGVMLTAGVAAFSWVITRAELSQEAWAKRP